MRRDADEREECQPWDSANARGMKRTPRVAEKLQTKRYENTVAV